MTQVRTIDQRMLRRRFAGAGVVVPVGPYAMWLGSKVAAFAADFADIYRPYDVFSPAESVADFGIDVDYTASWRRYFRPSVAAYCDISSPFVPMPPDLAFVSAEMAANWQITMGAGGHLLIHGAAVADAQDRALIMPGSSGSGKSTLAAMLAHHGWRLLADEFVMLDLATGLVAPYPRPISLKNAAIAAMRALTPQASISRAFKGTIKGVIAYVTPPETALALMHQQARPALVLFPQYQAERVSVTVSPMDPGELLMRVIAASANYSRLGGDGFDAATALAARTPALRIGYGDSRQALDLVEDLAGKHMAEAKHG